METSRLEIVRYKLEQLWCLSSNERDYIFDFIKGLDSEIVDNIAFVEQDSWWTKVSSENVISVEVINDYNSYFIHFYMESKSYSIFDESINDDYYAYLGRKTFKMEDEVDYNYVNNILSGIAI
jgi:hypothetical protein